jgi:uncharacterized protein YndB with AHSA1/START domain
MSDKAKIELEHLYKQPPAAVWKALTDPALHARWWAPGDVCAVVGHRFQLDMGQWGQQPCEVLEVVPERLLKYRFGIGGPDWTITWELSPEGSGTRLKLVQDGFDLDSPMGRHAFEAMGKGWVGILARMADVLG